MAEASRLSTVTRALQESLDALAEAMAQVRPEAAAAIAAEIETRAGDFRAAAALAVAAGEPLPLADAHAVRVALQRCRRLGLSITLLAAPYRAATDVPQGYSPVGHPVAPSSEGVLLTARG